MKISIIAVGKKMPDWVDSGFLTYSNRLKNDWLLELRSVPAPKRSKNQSIKKLMEIEAASLLEVTPKHTKIIALDKGGITLDTPQMAQYLQQYYEQSQDISLLIGGPDGLSPGLLQQAEASWSLSALTLPHPLVRVIVAEQIYRAWSLFSHHPYHR